MTLPSPCTRGFPHLVGVTLGTALLVGCASVPTGLSQNAPTADLGQIAMESAEAGAGSALPTSPEAFNAVSSPVLEAERFPSTVASRPQLVKQAHLLVVLADLEGAVETLQQIINQAQGNLIGLQDHRSPQGVAHEITLTLRVPYDRLELVLADIRALGTVQQQSITAEDVSDQLVDLEARLKNLRQSEAALLSIMERSGKISDVLEVSRELSNVRESIERLAAQQQSLQRQVAYSYIYLTLQSPASAVAPLRPAGETLGNTWQSATHSVKTFTLAGLKLSLWILAYSPYLVAAAFLAYGGYRLGRPRSVATVDGNPEQG